MNQLKLVLLVVLLPLIGHTQSKALSSTDTIQKNIQEKFKAFAAASTFFFETLDENFERDSNGENIYALMQIFSKPLEEPEDYTLATRESHRKVIFVDYDYHRFYIPNT